MTGGRKAGRAGRWALCDCTLGADFALPAPRLPPTHSRWGVWLPAVRLTPAPCRWSGLLPAGWLPPAPPVGVSGSRLRGCRRHLPVGCLATRWLPPAPAGGVSGSRPRGFRPPLPVERLASGSVAAARPLLVRFRARLRGCRVGLPAGVCVPAAWLPRSLPVASVPSCSARLLWAGPGRGVGGAWQPWGWPPNPSVPPWTVMPLPADPGRPARRSLGRGPGAPSVSGPRDPHAPPGAPVMPGPGEDPTRPPRPLRPP